MSSSFSKGLHKRLSYALSSKTVTKIDGAATSKDSANEKCGLYRGYRDTEYLPFYFQGYRILSFLLTGIWDTVLNILVTFRDIE